MEWEEEKGNFLFHFDATSVVYNPLGVEEFSGGRDDHPKSALQQAPIAYILKSLWTPCIPRLFQLLNVLFPCSGGALCLSASRDGVKYFIKVRAGLWVTHLVLLLYMSVCIKKTPAIHFKTKCVKESYVKHATFIYWYAEHRFDYTTEIFFYLVIHRWM